MSASLKPVESNYGIRSEYGHLIGGEWIAGSSGKTIALLNPATGETLTRIQAGNAEDIGLAVAAAKAAFPAWSQSSAAERQDLLYEIVLPARPTACMARRWTFPMRSGSYTGSRLVFAPRSFPGTSRS